MGCEFVPPNFHSPRPIIDTRATGAIPYPVSPLWSQSMKRFSSGRFWFVLSVALALATPALPATSKGAPVPAAKPDAKKEDPLPLKPDRKIEFTTDAGTWLSLDVSPDGQNLIFDLIGDLYTVPIAGGEAKKLTSGMAFNAQPAYSPEGKKIAFTSDRGGSENVWISD